MRILALILARGGSKRLPGKNIRLLGGKPLIVWSIDVAKGIPQICDILVSTDDPATAEVCTMAGALVPWLRPAELATDTSSSVDAALHSLDWYEAENGPVDGVMLLQPTSPFRSAETIRQAAALFESNGGRPVIGVSPAVPHPAWCFRVVRESLVPILGWDELQRRSQDLSPAYALNGAMYIITPDDLRVERTFITNDACPLMMNDLVESLDIDTEWDWLIAETALQKRCTLLLTSPRIMMSKNNGVAVSGTQKYISENEFVLNLPKRKILSEHKREYDSESLLWLAKQKLKALRGFVSYAGELWYGWRWVRKLLLEKNTKQEKCALVIGNGPSQGYISANQLKQFISKGGEVFVVNFWQENEMLSAIPPTYLVISDPATLNFEDKNLDLRHKNTALRNYLIEHESIKLLCPVRRCQALANLFGDHRVVGFVDSEVRGWGSSIIPIVPRSYLSMTLYKALAFSIWRGYEKIYLLGMDNTYPRDTYCNDLNQVISLETHAGADDYICDLGDVYRGVGDLMVDLSRIYFDAKKFSKYNILNLDPYSLTDAFQKVHTIDVGITLDLDEG